MAETVVQRVLSNIKCDSMFYAYSVNNVKLFCKKYTASCLKWDCQ